MAPTFLAVRKDLEGSVTLTDEGYESQQHINHDGLSYVSSPASDRDNECTFENSHNKREQYTPCVSVSRSLTAASGERRQQTRFREDDELANELNGPNFLPDHQHVRILPPNPAQLAPFRGEGLPTDIPISSNRTPHSEITDLGEERFANDRLDRGVSIRNPLNRYGYDNGNGGSLQDCLFAAQTQLETHDRKFLPRDDIENMITHEVVYRELSKVLTASTMDVIMAYSKTICTNRIAHASLGVSRTRRLGSFRKIFITLVLIDKTESIVQFIDEDVNDLQLPLILIPHVNGRHDGLSMRKSSKKLNCRDKGWSQLNIHNFEKYQWTTLAPFFGKEDQDEDAPHYALHEQVVLPFTHYAAIAKSGGFGQIYQTKIHPQHHNFDRYTSDDNLFAIKSLVDSTKKKEFTKEVEILKKLSKKNHNHLLTLLATYEQSDKYYLIFPWADSDLCQFWERESPDPSLDNVTVGWVAEQCQGLANGLSRIHQWNSTRNELQGCSSSKDLIGYHGDIKPANVLWFKASGMLKLSDFGLSDFDTRRTRSRRQKTNPCASPSYRAPEWDSPNGGVAGRSYDIWGLGCVFLEFATWLLGGWDLLVEFENTRKSRDSGWANMTTDSFFTLDKEGTDAEQHIVKPAVTQWIRQLQCHPRCSDFVKDFLAMIQTGMLVIIEGDSAEAESRFDSRQVTAELTRMATKCSSDKIFAYGPRTTSIQD